MTTKRLYYDDAFQREFTAEVLSCEPGTGAALGGTAQLETSAGAAALATANGPLWRVKLDRTAFYPTSGGQPYDTGQLGDSRVVDVVDEEDEVIHVVDKSIAIGPVQGTIDWHRRFDHMQPHTGQHVVYADRAVNVKYGTAEELAAAGVRKTVERSGTLRAIEIEALELQPCGGTHVRRTGQIGMIFVRGVSRIRQDWRVEFACGQRAERLAREDFATLRAVAQRLNCSPQEADSAAERVVMERDAHFKSARASMQRLAEMDARS